MFLIFNMNREIINLDNVATIETTEFTDDEVKVFLVTTANKFFLGDFLSPGHNNAFCKEFIVKKEEWLKFIVAVNEGKNTFVFKCRTMEE